MKKKKKTVNRQFLEYDQRILYTGCISTRESMNQLKIDATLKATPNQEKLKKSKLFAASSAEEELIIATLPTPMQLIEQIASCKEKSSEVVSTAPLDCLVKETIYCVHHVRESGVMEMRWEIDLPHLKKIEIQIRHYDTAPDRFHIEIATSAEVQEYLQKNLAEIEKKLSSELVKIPCYFTPITLIKNRPIIGTKLKEERKKIVESSILVYSAK
jgi:hypothetical protein